MIYHGSKEDYNVVNDDKIAVGLYHDEVSVVTPDTVGQFTEIHDAQGNEIYEGDVIVGRYGHLHAIRYNKMYGAYTATLLNEFLHTDLKTECSVTQRWLDETGKRVCGNVHDTPEFLKSK